MARGMNRVALGSGSTASPPTTGASVNRDTRPAARRLGQLARASRRLHLASERIAEEASVIASALAGLWKAASADTPGDWSGIFEPTLKQVDEDRRRKSDEAALKAAARGGVGRLEIQRNPNGSAAVWIDGRGPIQLGRREANLLEVLAIGPSGDDGFPAPQNRKSVEKRLAQKTGRKPSRGALNEVVRVLRKKISKDENRYYKFLVQTETDGGFRFLLRR
jgi:hypothetical protein